MGRGWEGPEHRSFCPVELGFITLSVGTCASCSVPPLSACISLGEGGGDTCRQAGCWGFSLCPGLSGECVKYSEK